MERRGFFKKAAASIIGGLLGLVPLSAGLAFLLDPLRRNHKNVGFIRITKLDTLNQFNWPKRFPVIDDRLDAWSHYPREPIGAVYLVRTGEHEVKAYQVMCPHATCPVDFETSTRLFLCPCHESSFNLDGSLHKLDSPSPRGLDELAVKIEGDDVLVEYKTFQQSTKQKIPLS